MQKNSVLEISIKLYPFTENTVALSIKRRKDDLWYSLNQPQFSRVLPIQNSGALPALNRGIEASFNQGRHISAVWL